MQKILFILLISIIILPLSAHSQQAEQISLLDIKRDTNIVLHFIPGNNMFYLAYESNKQNIEILQHIISQNLQEILRGNIFIKVNGYCCSFETKEDNIAAAKNRNNQVKSFLITNNRLREENFITYSSAKKLNGKSDIVKVSYLIKRKPTPILKDLVDTKFYNREKSDSNTNTTDEDTNENDEPAPSSVNKLKEKKPVIAIKTNILFDAALIPNIEIEIPIGKRWSVNTEYMFPWWLSKDNSKAMQMLSGGLEGRLWLGNRNRRNILCGHFLGLYAGGGMYDLRNNSKGYQGEFYIASGISYGYGLGLGRSFNLEFSLGIGYMVTHYRHYYCKEDNSILAWQNDGKYTWIGPTKAKVSLVWLIGNRNKNKGGRL